MWEGGGGKKWDGVEERRKPLTPPPPPFPALPLPCHNTRTTRSGIGGGGGGRSGQDSLTKKEPSPITWTEMGGGGGGGEGQPLLPMVRPSALSRSFALLPAIHLPMLLLWGGGGVLFFLSSDTTKPYDVFFAEFLFRSFIYIKKIYFFVVVFFSSSSRYFFLSYFCDAFSLGQKRNLCAFAPLRLCVFLLITPLLEMHARQRRRGGSGSLFFGGATAPQRNHWSCRCPHAPCGWNPPPPCAGARGVFRSGIGDDPPAFPGLPGRPSVGKSSTDDRAAFDGFG